MQIDSAAVFGQNRSLDRIPEVLDNRSVLGMVITAFPVMQIQEWQ